MGGDTPGFVANVGEVRLEQHNRVRAGRLRAVIALRSDQGVERGSRRRGVAAAPAARGIVSSHNVVVLGQLGKGKSALVKTYLDRQLRAGRQAFVLDPKGEYATLADRHGLPRLRLAPGGPARLNPLDALAADPVAAARRRTALVAALVGAGLGRALGPVSYTHLTLPTKRI